MKGTIKVVANGRLTKDAELSFAGDQGTPVLKFRLVANLGHGDHEYVEGLNCVVWGKRAEALAPHLSKGQAVHITGTPKTSSWEGDDGTRRYKTEVTVADLDFLGGPRADETA